MFKNITNMISSKFIDSSNFIIVNGEAYYNIIKDGNTPEWKDVLKNKLSLSHAIMHEDMKIKEVETVQPIDRMTIDNSKDKDRYNENEKEYNLKKSTKLKKRYGRLPKKQYIGISEEVKMKNEKTQKHKEARKARKLVKDVRNKDKELRSKRDEPDMIKDKQSGDRHVPWWCDYCGEPTMEYNNFSLEDDSYCGWCMMKEYQDDDCSCDSHGIYVRSTSYWM